MKVNWLLAVCFATTLGVVAPGRAEETDDPTKMDTADYYIYSRQIIRPPAKKNLPPITKIAVFPFKGEGKMGDAAANALIDTLQAEPNEYRLLDRMNMDLTGEEMKLLDRGIVDPATAARIGKAKGAQAVVVGSVDGYSPTIRVEQRKEEKSTGTKIATGFLNKVTGIEPATGPTYKTIWICRASLNVTVKLIDTESSEILASCSQPAPLEFEMDHDPGDGYQDELFRRVLGQTTKLFVNKISPHRVTLHLRFEHKRYGDNEAKALVNALSQDWPERALEKAQARVEAMRAKNAGYKDLAAAIFNLCAVQEATNDLESALRNAREANVLYDGHEMELPRTYNDTAKRLKQAIALEQEKQDK